jgi:hypothetical protein
MLRKGRNDGLIGRVRILCSPLTITSTCHCQEGATGMCIHATVTQGLREAMQKLIVSVVGIEQHTKESRSYLSDFKGWVD